MLKELINDYIANEKSVIPVYGKIAKVGKWNEYCDILPTEEEVKKWNDIPNTGIGLLSGRQNNLCFIDVDEEDQPWQKKLLDILPSSPVSKKGRKGETRFFQLPDDWENEGNIVSLKRDGKVSVEFFFNKKYTVIPPSQYYIDAKHFPEYDFRWNGLDAFTPNFDSENLPILDIGIIEELRKILPNNESINSNTMGRYNEIKRYAHTLVSKLTPYEVAVDKLLEYDIKHFNANRYFLDKTKNCITSNARINAHKYYADIVVSVNRRKKIGEPLELPVQIRETGVINNLEWGEVLDYRKFTLRPEFSNKLIPTKFKNWIETASNESGLQTDAVLMTALTGLSAVLGSKVTLTPKINSSWRIAPNFYTMIIFNSGGRKSQISNVGLMPIKKLAAQIQKDLEKGAKEKKIKDTIAKMELSELKEKIKKAIKDDNMQEAEKMMERSSQIEEELEKETVRRLIVKQTTPEALMMTMSKNNEGMLIVENEISGLMAKMKKKGYEMYRTLLLDMWDGTESGTYDTIARGRMHIPLLCGSVLAFGQPDLLDHVVKEAAGGNNDGLIQRFMIVTDDNEQRKINADLEIKAENYSEVDFIFDIAMRMEKREIVFSKKAFNLWKTVINCYESEAAKESNVIVRGMLRKRNSNLLCLSFLYNFISDTKEKEISAESLEHAIELVDYLTSLASHAIKSSTDKILEICDTIIKMIQFEEIVNGMTMTDVIRKDGKLTKDREITQQALTVLKRANIIKFQREGKSTTVFINPAPLNF